MRGKERERERERELKLLSTIYRDRLVGIRWGKNESSSTRRGLRVRTENIGFRRGFKQGVREIKGFGFMKCPRDFLKFLLRSKRWGFFLLWLFSILWAVWLSFNALRGCLAVFFPKGLFGKIMGYGNSALF